METIAEKVESITKCIGWLRDYGHQVDFALPTFENWGEAVGGLQELADMVGSDVKFVFVMRFSPSGRLRIASTYDEAWTLLMGMLTICSEVRGDQPFISEHDGMIVVN